MTVASSGISDPKLDTNGEVWSRVIGTIVCVIITTAFVSPRTIPYTMSILAVVMIAAAWIQHQTDIFKPKLDLAEWTILALLAYAVASMAWAARPSGAIVPILTAVGYFSSYVLISNAVLSGDRALAQRIAEGLCVGLALGVLYLGFEIFTNQTVKLYLYRELHIPRSWLRPPRDFKWDGDLLVAIEPTDLTRNIAPITLLLWAALLALRKIFRADVLWRVLSGLLFVVAALVIMKSEHETSKVALLFGVVVFVMASLSVKWSDRLLKLGWCFACLAVIPCVLALYRTDLKDAGWVQPSMRARIDIWNTTAEATFKAPILGVGAGMMYQIGEKGVERDKYPGLWGHAHNVFLQTWFEFGAVGPALLTLIGLAVIARMRSLPDGLLPYAHATFASATAIAAASYGMWQPWFIAMFAMCAAMFVAASHTYAVAESAGVAPEQNRTGLSQEI